MWERGRTRKTPDFWETRDLIPPNGLGIYATVESLAKKAREEGKLPESPQSVHYFFTLNKPVKDDNIYNPRLRTTDAITRAWWPAENFSKTSGENPAFIIFIPDEKSTKTVDTMERYTEVKSRPVWQKAELDASHTILGYVILKGQRHNPNDIGSVLSGIASILDQNRELLLNFQTKTLRETSENPNFSAPQSLEQA